MSVHASTGAWTPRTPGRDRDAQRHGARHGQPRAWSERPGDHRDPGGRPARHHRSPDFEFQQGGGPDHDLSAHALDEETPLAQLTWVRHNATLLAAPTFNGRRHLYPNADQWGTTGLTLTLSDGTLTATVTLRCGVQYQ